jgi:maltose alpha-D-glucosyltransferase/alpha-amylase
MFNNDRRRLELAHSLLLTLPGTPVMRYGDEIGMGEDLSLKERDSIRTPMQWGNRPNGGFSSAPPDKLVLPVIDSGDFGYARVNVAAQQRDSESLLNWLEHATRLRLRCPEFGSGRWQWLETSDPAVLAHCCHEDCSAVFAVHNLSAREIEVEVDLGYQAETLLDLLANREQEPASDGQQHFKLPPYGYYWLRADRGPESLSRCKR